MKYTLEEIEKASRGEIPLTPEMVEQALDGIREIHESSKMLILKPCSPGQAKVIGDWGGKRQTACLGPNRMGKCVSADTMVSGKRMDEIGFKKGTAQLWDIGGRLRATDEHRVLTEAGYATIRSLRLSEGDRPRVFVEGPSGTSWGRALLAHVVDAPNSWQRLEDFQSDYLSYFHSRGGRPRRRLMVAPDGSPLPDDADACRFSRQYEQERSHFYRDTYHHAKTHGLRLGHPISVFSDPDDETISSQLCVHTQNIELSSLSSDLQREIEEFLQDQNLSSDTISFIYWPMVRAYTFAVRAHISIKEDKVEDFYDTSIPFTRAYSSGGLISHNTTIGVYWLLCHLTGVYPDCWPESQRFTGPLRARIIVEEYKEHGKVIVNKLKEWAPEGFITKFIKNPQGSIVGFECQDGSFCSILTHEQSTDSHESWDGHIVWADEPCPQDKFIASLRGLTDHNGMWLFTLTPLKEPWLSDEIFEENPELWNVIELEAYSNPHISNEALERFYASCDPTQLEARKYGKFMHLMGAIYNTFTRQKHVVPQKTLPADWPRYMVCDPHDRRPFAMGWYAVDPMNRIWVYDEYPGTMFHKIASTDLKTHDFANIIRDKEKTDVIARRIIDRRYGYRRSVQTGTTIAEEFARYSLPFDSSYDDAQGGIEAGHIAVKDYLGRLDQEPRIFVMENCINHIYSFTHYVYDEKTGKPQEHGKDFMDLVRYLAKDNPRYDVWQSVNQKSTETNGVSGYGE